MRQSAAILAAMLTIAGTPSHAQVKNLCAGKERTIWSCEAGKKIYSLCASPDLSASAGYLEYRAGRNAASIEFVYPKPRQHPKGKFEFGLAASGAMLDFSNGAYEYGISEGLMGLPWITVQKDGKNLAEFQCRSSTSSLTDNETIDLFRVINNSPKD